MGSQTGIGLASGVLWPGAALEQWSNRSPELGSAAAMPVSVSRLLVSTSVQFGQSAAGKTESDQWLLAAHLLSEQMPSSATIKARTPLREQIWNTLLRPVWRMQIRRMAV